MESHSRHWAPDVRRRLRAKAGPASHALKTLAEAYRRRGRYIAGSIIMLIGFDEVGKNESASKEAAHVADTLVRFGASVVQLKGATLSGGQFRSELMKRIDGVDALLIDTDSKHFRAFRPRELKEHGPDVVIPTTLRA